MTTLKLLFNWLVLIPAAGVDYLIASIMGILALAAPVLAWHWTIRLIEPSSPGILGHDFPGKPRNFSTWIIASIAALYVFALAGEAIYHLPRVMLAMATASD